MGPLKFPMRLQPTRLVSTLQPLICSPLPTPPPPASVTHSCFPRPSLRPTTLCSALSLTPLYVTPSSSLCSISLSSASPYPFYIFLPPSDLSLSVHLPLAFHPFSSSLPYIFSLTLHTGPNLFPRPPSASSLPLCSFLERKLVSSEM